MKVVIAGPRDLNFLKAFVIADAVRTSGFEVTELVHGGASGVDRAGELWAKDASVPTRAFYPYWKTHGRAAGPIRNREMAAYADALIVVKQKGVDTPGTSSMIREAEKAGLPVHIEEL